VAPSTDTGTSIRGLVFVAGFERVTAVERVRPVRGGATVDGALVVAVAQHVVDRGVGAIDGDLCEVRPAEPQQLRVEVGEQPPGQQRVVGDVDAPDQMAGVERDLLGFGEVVRRVGGEREGADRLQRGKFLGDHLGRIEARKAAQVSEAAAPLDRNTPGAAAPRACTTRSGMRSWSKCMIFSRR
jgi:hypothetical protein